MNRKIRIGICGGGGILSAHAPAYKKLAEKCEVVAVAEPIRDRQPRVRDLLGPEVKVLDDYTDVIAMDDIDAVDIILPHNLHMPAAVAAAETGKHVLTEKVMARNIHECDAMIDACERAGVTLTVSHDRRYHGEWSALKEVVDSGVLGEIFYWKLDHNQNVVFPEGSWVRTRDGIGGGAIMSCLTHQIDSLRWYGGEVESVSCMTKVLPERMEGEALSVVVARMASGALAQLSINWWTRSNNAANGLWYEMVQVCGTKGEAYYTSGKGTFLLVHEESEIGREFTYEGTPSTDGFTEVKASEVKGHECCLSEWVKMLRGEESNVMTSGGEVRGTVEVAEAAYIAAETGRTVTLPIEPTPWKSSS